jgi:hypothetical protein
MKTMFFNFNQNNSGGYFVEDFENGVCEEIIIEANTAKDAIKIFEEIGEKVSGFYDSCPCCGERWSTWIDDQDGTERPEIYGTLVENVKKGIFTKNCFVHYIDGTFKRFEHK